MATDIMPRYLQSPRHAAGAVRAPRGLKNSFHVNDQASLFNRLRLLSATGLQPLIKATPKGDNQNITTIELPLTDTNTAPGLIELGVLVEVQDIAGD